jgi:hypothetical protein
VFIFAPNVIKLNFLQATGKKKEKICRKEHAPSAVQGMILITPNVPNVNLHIDFKESQSNMDWLFLYKHKQKYREYVQSVNNPLSLIWVCGTITFIHIIPSGMSNI